ncbi:hypothetical protein JR316_0011627 [Psilocybe cubensis]|uniref:Uncharacterized protein n=2 Tax=Psilocybe cubensis TaxID=181762 RepID=A0ACB8GKY9_PSICU|nr:hypothetical protein JR316_0011627 [Psilocybe cubensis]KAH9476057.1 hypothetical protein JR316_0011627 [Psilocybe cubensis]
MRVLPMSDSADGNIGKYRMAASVTYSTMQFTFAAIAAAFVAGAQLVAASPAPAEEATNAADFGINIGSTFNNVVAWVDGQSKCNNVVIAAAGTNFCGHSFNLNGRTFTVNGCGGPLWVTQGPSNTFWANCGSLSEADACGVHTNWHCL